MIAGGKHDSAPPPEDCVQRFSDPEGVAHSTLRRDPFRVGMFLRLTGGGANSRLLAPGYHVRPIQGQKQT